MTHAAALFTAVITFKPRARNSKLYQGSDVISKITNGQELAKGHLCKSQTLKQGIHGVLSKKMYNAELKTTLAPGSRGTIYFFWHCNSCLEEALVMATVVATKQHDNPFDVQHS